MITNYLLATAATIALASGGWGYWQHSKVEGLQTKLAAEEARVRVLMTERDIAKDTARLEAERAEKQKARADDVQDALETMITGNLNNADTPIDPRLTAFLICLRQAGTDAADCSQHLD